jgi:hypothetical protein
VVVAAELSSSLRRRKSLKFIDYSKKFKATRTFICFQNSFPLALSTSTAFVLTMNKRNDSEWVTAITKTVSFQLLCSPRNKTILDGEGPRASIVLFMAFEALVSLSPDHVSMFIYFLAAPAAAN